MKQASETATPHHTETLKPLDATAFQPETRMLVSTETKTDVEAEIAKQIRTIQSYNWKLNNNVGSPKTARDNIDKALDIINVLKQESNISDELNEKVEQFEAKFQNTKP